MQAGRLQGTCHAPQSLPKMSHVLLILSQKSCILAMAAPPPSEKAQELPPRQPSLPSNVHLGEHPSVCHLPDGSTKMIIFLGMGGWGFQGPCTHTMAQRRQEEGVPWGCHWQGLLENHPSSLRNQRGKIRPRVCFLINSPPKASCELPSRQNPKNLVPIHPGHPIGLGPSPTSLEPAVFHSHTYDRGGRISRATRVPQKRLYAFV